MIKLYDQYFRDLKNLLKIDNESILSMTGSMEVKKYLKDSD